MKYNKESKASLEYIDEKGKQSLHERDYIICRTKDGKRYIGKIAMIGRYQENEETEPEDVICIHIPKGKTSYHGEIIKVADIAQICRNPAIDSYEYFKEDKERDRSNFKSMIIGLGYSEEKAEFIYDSLKDIINIYNVPLSPFLGSVIQSVDLSMGEASQEELIEVSNKVLGALVKMFDVTTDLMKEKMRGYIASQDLEQ